MGILDGGLTETVGAAFGWIMLPGKLYRRDLQSKNDGKGGFTEAGFAAPEAIKIMVDKASEQMRRENGFDENDVGLLILAFNTDTGTGTAKPRLDDEAEVETGPHAGRYHILGPIDADAAGTHYMARGRKL